MKLSELEKQIVQVCKHGELGDIDALYLEHYGMKEVKPQWVFKMIFPLYLRIIAAQNSTERKLEKFLEDSMPQDWYFQGRAPLDNQGIYKRRIELIWGEIAATAIKLFDNYK